MVKHIRNKMIKLGQVLNMGMDKYTPDSFLFAVLLTFIIYALGILLANKGPFEMIQFWYKGFWGFLAFSMQMLMIMITGYTVATSPSVSKGIHWLVSIPKTSLSACMLIFLVSSITSFIHWGLGLIVGALLAPRLGRQLEKLDFKLLVCASYLGWIVGALGISISIALLVNTPGHFLQKMIGLIPMSQTSLHPGLLLPTIINTFITVPLMLWLLHPEQSDVPKLDEKIRASFAKEVVSEEAEAENSAEENTFATRVENSSLITLLLSVMGFAFCAHWFYTKRFNLDFNFFNFMMLFLGIALHKTPKRFYTSFAEGVKLTWGIVLQYPFYAGIQGMMASSGMVPIIVGWFIAIATPQSFPFWTYISSSIVNLFIPSSGGILLVQGPIMLEAGAKLGVSYPAVLRAFMAGEQISNVIQPFFAIPLLAMAGMKMRDIMGYCIIFYIVLSVVYNISFLIF